MSDSTAILPAKQVAALTSTEAKDLRKLESVIERGQKTFIEVGKALMEINQRKLYRDTHSTFPDYCREKWGFAKSRAYQLIESAKVVGNVHSCGQIEPPANEAQARPLAQLPVAQQANAWQDVVDECKERGEPVTAAAVADVVEKYKAQAEPYREQEQEPDEEPDGDEPGDEPGEVVEDTESGQQHQGHEPSTAGVQTATAPDFAVLWSQFWQQIESMTTRAAEERLALCLEDTYDGDSATLDFIQGQGRSGNRICWQPKSAIVYDGATEIPNVTTFEQALALARDICNRPKPPRKRKAKAKPAAPATEEVQP